MTIAVALTSCSTGGTDSTESPASSVPAASPASTTPSGSVKTPSSPTPTASGVDCVKGRYKLVSFASAGKDGSRGLGTGGDLAITFDAKKFVVATAGKTPAQITIGGVVAKVTLTGKLPGTFTLPDDQHVTFTPGKATGSATLQVASGQKRTITADQLAGVLIPKGTAEATCGEDTLVLKTDRVTLKLAR